MNGTIVIISPLFMDIMFRFRSSHHLVHYIFTHTHTHVETHNREVLR